MIQKIQVKGEAKIVKGHVLDVSRPHLLAALRSYDPLLYLLWNPKKRGGLGSWELRRRPEFMTVREGEKISTPRGWVYRPGDVFEFEGYTISVPKYHETNVANHVKDFDILDYRILDWLKKHDMWDYGFKGKNVGKEAEYREAKYLDKIDNDSAEERNYMIKQNRTAFQDFASYINSGGNPYKLIDYWGKQ